eukprot:15018-Heterococcus_DN1.PRE.1
MAGCNRHQYCCAERSANKITAVVAGISSGNSSSCSCSGQCQWLALVLAVARLTVAASTAAVRIVLLQRMRQDAQQLDNAVTCCCSNGFCNKAVLRETFTTKCVL